MDEVPVTPSLVVSGPNSRTYDENGTDAVGEYQAVGTGADMVRWIPLEGADADYFEVDGSGSSVMLKFRSPPDHEMPRGMAMTADNTNTYMVTVKIEHTPSGTMAQQDVVVTVVDTIELGDAGPALERKPTPRTARPPWAPIRWTARWRHAADVVPERRRYGPVHPRHHHRQQRNADVRGPRPTTRCRWTPAVTTPTW